MCVSPLDILLQQLQEFQLWLVITLHPQKVKHGTYFCKTYLSLVGFQHCVNRMTIMAISIERFYSIKFPLHAFKSNTFFKMMKFSMAILLISFLQVVTMISIGFSTGYIVDYPSACTGHYVFGDEGTNLFMITFVISSLIGFTMTGMIIFLLVHKQWTQNMNQTIHHNTEYRITKMLCTGKRHSVNSMSIYLLLFFTLLTLKRLVHKRGSCN